MDILEVKKQHLSNELELSVQMIQLGLGELQRIYNTCEHHYLTCFLLSNGLERLVKCALCYHKFNTTGIFPTLSEIKGHQLKDLITKIISIFESNETTNSIQALYEDYEFIKDNKYANEIVNILTEFGTFSRYYNLDIVVGSPLPSKDIEELWSELEKIITNEKSDLKQLYEECFKNNDKWPELFLKLTQFEISIIEKYIRGISRLFCYKFLGNDASSQSHLLFPFSGILDENLGKKEYSKISSE